MPLRDDGHGFSKYAFAALAMAAFLLAGATGTVAQEIATDPHFDARGFSERRDAGSLLPFEHVDPFTGNLLLTFTDLRLPGNAGFDLVIQRTYNSKIYATYGIYTLEEDSWAGLGWSLHMGRVIEPSPGGRAIVEMPDGSRHPVYAIGSNPQDTITRTLWRYDSSTNPPTLRLTNGVVYRFGHIGNTTWDGRAIRYATQITDPYGNNISISYATAAGAPRDAIREIVQDLGTQQRSVTFSYSSTKGSLSTMEYWDGRQTRRWQYGQSSLDRDTAKPHSELDWVQPPVGPGWSFSYNHSAAPYYELTGLTTPNGGFVNYVYDWVSYNYCKVAINPPTQAVLTRGVVRRTTSGRDIPGGIWTYAYAQGTTRNQTVVSSPCNRTVYTYYGIGGESGQWCPNSQMLGWQIGAQLGKEVWEGNSLLQRESSAWGRSVVIGNGPETVGHYTMTDIYNPLLVRRTVERFPGGADHVTTHEYGTANYNDYGRPWRTTESGQLTRTTTRSFDYAFTPYIRDRIGSETIDVSGESPSYTTSAEYRDSDGFKTSENVYGVTRTFGSAAGGNVGSVRDALGNQTSFSYSWGVLEDTSTPRYSIDRAINPSGTVQREVRRGATTTYDYELFRPTLVQPPLGNATTYQYDDADGSEATTRRGASALTQYFDGFGRVTRTVNSQGVTTDVGRDSCGRVTYESYPYFSGTTGVRTSFTRDGLGRLRQANHPDDSWTSYSYNNADVTVQELVLGSATRSTFQDRSAFGDPDDSWLTGFRDGNGQSWSYAYNALGRLRTVSSPTGRGRSWSYNAKSQLQSEFHPESGTTSYTYDDAGRVRTRTDANAQTTVFYHDGNGRLTYADGPGGADTSFDWDASDNRTLADNGRVRSVFAFDANNRLYQRIDTVGGQTFASGYGHDGNDNLSLVEYPSGLSVSYAVNSEGQVTDVRKTGSSTPYATSFLYHPSGAVRSFSNGNGKAQAFTYDSRFRIDSLRNGVLDLNYDHDYVGNVRTIHDTRAGKTQSFGYDGVDRLASASGWYGSGSIGYTADGDRFSSTIGGSSGFGYSGARLTSVTGAGADSFQYDANGNMRTSGGGANVYTYSPENFMESARVGGVTTSYLYDADAMRKRKAITGGGTRYFVHGGGNQLLAEYDTMCTGGTRLVKNYVYAGSRLIAAVTPAVPTISLESDASTVGEAAGSVPVRVKLTTPAGTQTEWVVCVNYSTVNGTAVAGSDYGATQGVLSFPIGTPSGTSLAIGIPILNDPDMNDTENFELRLASAQGANMAGAATHTVTIQDDDAPTIAFTSPSTPVAEASGTSQVLVRVTSRDGLPLTAVTTVSYATVNGTAVGGADFVPAAGVLTFPAGFASGGTLPIPVMVTADALNEDAETFQVVLSNPVNAVVGTPSAHAITIADDDPLPSLYVQHATVPEPTGDGADALVTVVLTAPSGRLVSAGYATSDVTASAGADYVAASGTVTFAPGTTSQTIAVRVLPDMLDEANEAFLVRLSAPVGALLADGEAQGVILDDDGGPQRCTPIASLPFTISASGQYCLVRHLAMDASTGIAIHIDADQVDLDLGGFTLSGRAAGVGTSAHGIYAIDRSSITVRNGAVDGFFVGVGLNDTSPDVSGSGGHRVEGVRAADNTYVGIDVRGRGNVVRDNQVQRTGGTTFFSAGNDTFGLFTRGSSVRVLGNDVSGTRAAAGRRGYGISIVDARAAVVEGNRVEGQSGTNGVGIWLIRSADALALGNAISATTHGLLFDQSSGKYRDNVCAAVTTPYSGGTDAGNNH